MNTESLIRKEYSPLTEGSEPLREAIHITECPRDGQQGLPYTIPPEKRAFYINSLMKAGFDIIDFGSFVSPKAVPQMAESARVLSLIDKSGSSTKLLAIVGNLRGAEEAAAEEKLDIIGFPYSISDTFLQKNIHSSINAVFQTTLEIKKAADAGEKALRVYISMAFGNPYGDPWSEQILNDHIQQLVSNGIRIITLSDTIGLGTASLISRLFEKFLPLYPGIELGIHLHTQPEQAYGKIEAAWNAGCRHFDGVLNGIGGCPLTGYELLGNVNTLEILRFCKEKGIPTALQEEWALDTATSYSDFRHLLSGNDDK